MNSHFFLDAPIADLHPPDAPPANLTKTVLRLSTLAAMFGLFISMVQATQARNTDRAAVETIEVDGVLMLKTPVANPDRNLLAQFIPFVAPPTTTTTVRAWSPLREQSGQSIAQMFQHQSQSLVAKAVGSAEGTRQPDGGTNRAYYGHVDPGNAVWNVGTFSYQHCGKCAPEEADRRQLQRLAAQFTQIQRYAQQQYNMQLSLEAQLNAIDLANQAPLAALTQGGFIDRLDQAHRNGLTGSDAILQARVYAYKNPTTNRWEAPGLGNTLSSITHDQARRQAAIARAIELHH
jgi:hypothetical protein